jgi:hypothetical protein
MDLTAPNVELAQDLYAYAFAHHSYAMMWMAVYLVAKLAARLLWGRGLDSNQISRKIWDPVCLFHNFLSVGIGFYAAYGWESSPSDACGGISDPAQGTARLVWLHASPHLFFIAILYVKRDRSEFATFLRVSFLKTAERITACCLYSFRLHLLCLPLSPLPPLTVLVAKL